MATLFPPLLEDAVPDLQVFVRFAQLALQLFSNRCLILGFILLVHQFDVGIVHLDAVTLDHNLYVIHYQTAGRCSVRQRPSQTRSNELEILKLILNEVTLFFSTRTGNFCRLTFQLSRLFQSYVFYCVVILFIFDSFPLSVA